MEALVGKAFNSYPLNLPHRELRKIALIQNNKLVFSIVIAYVIFVKWIIPHLMKNRKPFQIRKIIICYNFTVSFLNYINTYKLFVGISATWFLHCNYKHQPQHEIDYSMQLIYPAMVFFYVLKYVELLDTVMFALRKKDKQITFLHVFHHSVMIIILGVGLKSDTYGYYTILAFLINSFVHVVMYIYYGLAAFGPSIQKYLWWKRYLTLMQIMQFVFVLLYAIMGFITGCEDINKIDTAEFILFFFLVIILLLFMNFYRKSFNSEKDKLKTKAT